MGRMTDEELSGCPFYHEGKELISGVCKLPVEECFCLLFINNQISTEIIHKIKCAGKFINSLVFCTKYIFFIIFKRANQCLKTN